MSTPIAIVGVGGVFPGAPNLEAFWKQIVMGRSAVRAAPKDRWRIDPSSLLDPTIPTVDRVYSLHGGFIEDFQADFSGLELSSHLIAQLDPLYHLLLAAGRQAFDDARLADLDQNRVGVIIGQIALPTEKSTALALEILGRTFQEKVYPSEEIGSGFKVAPINRLVTGLPAGVLAAALGLGGKTLTLDAACASSLFALKMAVDELQAGRADAMLGGGLCRPDTLYTQMGFSQLRALSPSGRCAPFDEQADGLVVGEGAGIVVLKRLADALAGGDQIYGLIRGLGLSNDVLGNLLAPHTEGQLRAMQAAYRQAGWRPWEVDLIEGHGTGTPVGDAVEIESLNQLWSEAPQSGYRCILGSVKSNIGHLLTGAGAAGLIKVLLALKHATLPPTANYRSPRPELQRPDTPFQVLTSARPWEEREPGQPRRAAVSAFGFGGINAHVLIEEWPAKVEAVKSTAAPVGRLSSQTTLAIVGIEACVGPWRDRQAFQQRVLGAEEPPDTDLARQWWGVPESRWFKRFGFGADDIRGYFLDQVQVPFGRFRIPPTEIKDMLPQQALMLLVGAQAIGDAGYHPDQGLQTGIFIGLSLDLRTTDFHLRWSLRDWGRDWATKLGLDVSTPEVEAWIKTLTTSAGPPLTADRTIGALAGVIASRIAREFKIGGPCFTLSSEECSGLSALDAAARALCQGEIDQALVGAVDLAGDIRVLLSAEGSSQFFSDARTIVGDQLNTDPPAGEGAVALVLKRLTDARRDGNRIYALVKGLGAAQIGLGHGKANPEGYRRALSAAYEEARLDPASVQLLVTHGSGRPQEDQAAAKAHELFFARPAGSAPLYHSGITSDIGRSGAVTGLAGVAKAALALYQEILPSVANIDPPGKETAGGGIIQPTKPRFWLHDRAEGPRRAGVSSAGVSGQFAHLVLEADDGPQPSRTLIERRQPLGSLQEALFVLDGQDHRAIEEKISRLHEMARSNPSLSVESLARDWRQAHKPDNGQPSAMSLIARGRDELRHLLDQGIRVLAGSFAIQELGDRLFFTTNHLGRGSKPALVFPGSGNHFAGMGRDLSVAWPDVLRRQGIENNYLGRQYLPELFWSEMSEPAAKLDLNSIIIGQVALGSLVSDVLDHLGVRPQAVIGYSLGESAGLFALRAWSDRDEMLARLTASTLFTSDLAGPCLAARRTWGLPIEADPHWLAGLVDVSAERLRQALLERSRVYLLIINTPEECLIGGERAAVRDLLRELDCHFVPISSLATVHCEVVKAVAQAYRELHLLKTTPPAGIDFYSAAAGKTYNVTSDSAADSILAQAGATLDFPRLIEQAYADGVRIFIEAGPGTSCTRMIKGILGSKPHLVRSACRSDQDGILSVFQVLADLITHRVPLDLTALDDGLEMTADRGTTDIKHADKVITLATDGPPFAPPPPPRSSVGADLGVCPLGRTRRCAPTNRLLEKEGEGGRPAIIHPLMTDSPSHPPRPLTMEPVDRPTTAVYPPRDDFLSPILREAVATQNAQNRAHAQFLRLAEKLTESAAENLAWQMKLIERMMAVAPRAVAISDEKVSAPIQPAEATSQTENLSDQPAFDRAKCLEFARGAIGRVLGPDFEEIDSFPTRVRLPDEPLMLVDRIIEVQGRPRSMTSGRLVTEHDVQPRSWYLDGGRIPTSLAIEAGQADLFLSAYLGIDFQTRGLAVYRLLDAEVTFHDALPRPGQVITYDIRLEKFFRLGETFLFRFNFDGRVGDRLLLTMRHGCAGFFTPEELEAGRGLVTTFLDKQPTPKSLPSDWVELVPRKVGAFNKDQLDALRAGDLPKCFGPAFSGLSLASTLTIPSGRLGLVDRVLEIDPQGGPYGLGVIRTEADIQPGAWFLTCHFVDDQVMPGTLMYESCLISLKVFMLQLGWVGEAGDVVFEPVPGVASRLKCRGQVIESTRTAAYEIFIKELGYRPEPYALADALMYADGRAVVEIVDMSLQLSGTNLEKLRELWSSRSGPPGHKKPAIFDKKHILSFASGKPSTAFGPAYRDFDEGRFLARLPAPPYSLIDRITAVQAEAFKMVAGASCESQLDVLPEAWYLQDNHGRMSLAILLETALQTCGWLAAYMGSALTSHEDLAFRNLSGSAVKSAEVTGGSGTLTTRVKAAKIATSGGLIIQEYDFNILSPNGPVYQGQATFGFFSRSALGQQVGLPNAKFYQPSPKELEAAKALSYPEGRPYPAGRLRMIDHLSHLIPSGGPHQAGYLRGTRKIDPDDWFFKAHFLQDPVWPGSLGLEAFIQLLQAMAIDRWKLDAGAILVAPAIGHHHRWLYRGQVIPAHREVTVEAIVKEVRESEKIIIADGLLAVDGLIIYQMNDFSIQVIA